MADALGEHGPVPHRDRTDEDERKRLRREVAGLLRDRGAHDLVRVLDANMIATAADPRTPQDAQDLLGELADVPLEAAVFVTPIDHDGPPADDEDPPADDGA